MSIERPTLRILGTRGIPAAHGGFETFAERLALFLVDRGWRVVVYCQGTPAPTPRRFTVDRWRGVERVCVRTTLPHPFETMEFDWHALRHAAAGGGACLVLGYNTAAFLPLLRLRGRKILTNMDGMEWRRAKWGMPARAWLYANEWIGARLSHRLVADHPAIAEHLATRRDRAAIVTIPYGGDDVTAAPVAPLAALGLNPGGYLVSIARIEPDNNILGLVRAFSRRPRAARLVVLGTLAKGNRYHQAVVEAASPEVLFPGAIYDKEMVQALRFHARAYCHGHMVGGTNPSLVEAMWCGNAVLAHRNRFNLWTAGSDQFFFADEDGCDGLITRILADDVAVARARRAARARAADLFDWDSVLSAYERELAALAGFVRAPADAAGGAPAEASGRTGRRPRPGGRTLS
jgi:glycosyltransferase involved in cell wall biosynthesis